ncbi:MAG: STAS domain-containing protein [Vicinamibacterales bacterium]
MTAHMAQETLDGDVFRVAPEGRLDSFGVPAFEALLNERLDAGHPRLVVDLAGVTYVSSRGLRALLSARRRARSAGGDVVLCNMSARVREIFEMVGFMSLFTIVTSVQEAAQLLKAGVSARL